LTYSGGGGRRKNATAKAVNPCDGKVGIGIVATLSMRAVAHAIGKVLVLAQTSNIADVATKLARLILEHFGGAPFL